jgi:glycine betaine/proline transport system ATP-binding protein
VAHKLMREQQQAGLYVTGRDRSLLGYVMEERIAHRLDERTVQSTMEPVTTVVRGDAPLSALFTPSAETRLPLPVVDDDNRLLGVIPRVTLLSALGTSTTQPVGEADVSPAPILEEAADAR